MKEETLIRILKSLGTVFLLLFCLSPFLWMLLISFSSYPDFLLRGTPLIFTFNNYLEILTTKSIHLLTYLQNSIIISIIASLLAVFFASLSAYAITRLTFPGKLLIPLSLLAFSMFPQVSIVGYLFKMMTQLGWINTYNALIFPYATLGLPLALWIMMSYFSQISIELDKAALIDGAGRFQILRKIIIPLSFPGIFSAFILVFIYSFNEFLFALMFTIDYKARTIPVGIALFEGLHGQIPWGYIMAASVVAIIPVIFLISFFRRYIISGITEGAVKG